MSPFLKRQHKQQQKLYQMNFTKHVVLDVGAGEMAQKLRVLAVLAKEKALLSGTLQLLPVTPTQEDPIPSSGSFRHLHTCARDQTNRIKSTLKKVMGVGQ